MIALLAIVLEYCCCTLFTTSAHIKLFPKSTHRAKRCVCVCYTVTEFEMLLHQGMCLCCDFCLFAGVGGGSGGYICSDMMELFTYDVLN